MICLLNQTESLGFPKADDGFIATKIKSNDLSYGRNYTFLNFWHQKNGGKITAIICKFEDTVFLCANEDADFYEIRDFIFAIGFKTVQADLDVIEKLGFEATESFICLVKETCGKNNSQNSSNLKTVYNLLYGTKEKNIFKTEFEGWYADMSHRIRHGTALAVVLEDSAACVVSHITKTASVISGVITDVEKRNRGLGSEVLQSTLERLKCSKVFVATDKITANFYLKNGFKTLNKIGIYRS